MLNEEYRQTLYGVKETSYDGSAVYYGCILDDAEIVSWTLRNEDVYELVFKIHEDQSDFWKNEHQVDYFGYLRKDENRLTMIYSSIALFSMCFANGFEANVAIGDGIAYRLQLVSEKIIIKKRRGKNHE